MSLAKVVCGTLLLSLLHILFLPSATGATNGSSLNIVEKIGIEIPHGGYDLNSDACDQCHDVNETAGDFVLSRWRTIADICGSCHYLYKTTAVKLPPRSNPPGAPKSRVDRHSPTNTSGRPSRNELAAPSTDAGVSVGSQYSAYEFSRVGERPFSEHILQRGPGTWRYNDAPDKLSIADHIPGGSGRLRGVLNFAPLMGLSCGSCHTAHIDSSQRLAMVSVAGELQATVLRQPDTKSDGSSDSGDSARSLIKNSWELGGGQWCAECHDRLTTKHNHPELSCLQCHSGAVNNSTEQPNDDFPHTSYNTNLLTNEGDALCITCHVPGSIP